MSEHPIDLDALRAVIEVAPHDCRLGLPTNRSWLEQVEREIREGRAAKALLAAQGRIAGVIDDIGAGART
jgi:hypothetical protein